VQVVKANIAGKPLEQARQAKIGGAESLLDIYKRALGMLPDADATAQAAE